MEVMLLGTASAEGIPSAYCDCPICTEARRRGGCNIRSRSGALIDDDLKIDHGPDTFMQMQRIGRSLGKVKAILFTHNHPDHLYSVELKRLYAPSTNTRPMEPVPIFGPKSVCDKIREAWIPENIKPLLEFHELHPLEAAVTPMGDTILPLPARHAPDCFVYRISRGGRSVLYGHDTGVYLPETLQALGDGVALDLALMDCTLSGAKSANQHHCNIEGMLAMIAEMRQRGAITGKTRIVATHFSHNGRMLHEELVRALLPHGVEVAYDGMRLILEPGTES